MDSTLTLIRGLRSALLVCALAGTLGAGPARVAAQVVVDAPAGAVATSPQAATAGDIAGLDLDWLDESRKRVVPVRLYMPPGASVDRPVPLVVFSHGIGGSRLGYSYLGRFWASQGYASLHVQHVGSDRELWSGSRLGLIWRLHGAAQEEEAIARVADLRFALDQILAHAELGPRIDAARIAAAGHSYGANTVMLASGAQVERNGRVLDLADARIKAAILLSAPPFYGETDIAKILGAVKVPSLHITATGDEIRIPGYFSGAEDRIAVFDAMTGPRKALAVFEGGSHSMFTDRGGRGDGGLNPQVKVATRELALAFMASVFDRDESALTQWHKRFAAILSRFTASVR